MDRSCESLSCQVLHNPTRWAIFQFAQIQNPALLYPGNLCRHYLESETENKLRLQWKKAWGKWWKKESKNVKLQKIEDSEDRLSMGQQGASISPQRSRSLFVVSASSDVWWKPGPPNPGGAEDGHPSASQTAISLFQASFQETLRSLSGKHQKLLRLSHGKSGAPKLVIA